MGVCIFLFVVVFNGCKRSKKQNKQKKKLGHIQNRQQELQSKFVFWMGKQLHRHPEAHKAKQANKKTSETCCSLLEAKIDTVLNAPGRVQPQIDSVT